MKVAIIDKSFDLNKVKCLKGQIVHVVGNNENVEDYDHGNECLNIFLNALKKPINVSCYAIGHSEKSAIIFSELLNSICERYDMIFMSIGIANPYYADAFKQVSKRQMKNWILAAGDNRGKICFPASLRNIAGVSCVISDKSNSNEVFCKKNPLNGIQYICEAPYVMNKQYTSNSHAVPYMAALIVKGQLKVNYIDYQECKIFDREITVPILCINGKIENEFVIEIREILLEEGYVGAVGMRNIKNDCSNFVFCSESKNKKQLLAYIEYITDADYILLIDEKKEEVIKLQQYKEISYNIQNETPKMIADKIESYLSRKEK